MTPPGRGKQFLFLQGPHGPFFYLLGRMLQKAGAQVWRVGFNKGDEAFWFASQSYIPFTAPHETWEPYIAGLLADKQITDIVLYGDTRPIHAQAITAAKQANIRVHVFEEGYLRPYWVTYERDGTNGNSSLMRMSVSDMQAQLTGEADQPHAPAKWGDMRQHIFYGALYHYFVLLRNSRYRNFKPHRALSVTQEFRLYLRRLLTIPATALYRAIATTRIKYGGFPYHLVLLQLEHDASFRDHSPFSTMREFLDLALGEFAKGAPPHHHLVFKAHPLEDGRVPLRREITRIAHEKGLRGRVHFVSGGKLARLLDTAKSAVTVNSTAAQQVLWRGLPLKIFGQAVYDKPEFTSPQNLADFFANPKAPDAQAYRDYRRYLLASSQIPGGFYSARGRRHLLRGVVDMVLAAHDPYDALYNGTTLPRQQLKLITRTRPLAFNA